MTWEEEGRAIEGLVQSAAEQLPGFLPLWGGFNKREQPKLEACKSYLRGVVRDVASTRKTGGFDAPVKVRRLLMLQFLLPKEMGEREARQAADTISPLFKGAREGLSFESAHDLAGGFVDGAHFLKVLRIPYHFYK